LVAHRRFLPSTFIAQRYTQKTAFIPAILGSPTQSISLASCDGNDDGNNPQ
jgi:hypothetical protein